MPFTKPKASQIDFDVTNITDPLIRLNSGESGSADKDVGIVIERGSDTNAAIIYDESANEFVVINTSETGTTSGNVSISSYAPLQVSTFKSSGATMTGAIAMGTNKITGLGDPTANQDAATKAYVDTQTSGLSQAADDLTAGDAAVTLTTTSGNITIDAQGNDTDIIFKGTDGGSDTTFLTLDGSAAGRADFNNGVTSLAYFWQKTDGNVSLYSGANFEIQLQHVHNTGLTLKNSGTGTPAVELQFVDSNEAIGSDGTNLKLTSGGNEITVPNGGADTMTLNAATQTLTNKTLTSPTINAFSGTGNGSITGTLSITTTTTDDSLLITTTEASSSAAPVITMKRNSASPADSDYLGQLKFKGENDADQEIVYAKITGKILDASDGTEDGIIEFANKKAGSNVITARLRSDSLQLLNSTNLNVAGTTTLTGNVSLEAQADLQFYDSDSSNYVGFQAPATISSNVLWTLPNTDGTDGQIIKTDGAGTLSWTDNSGGGGSGSSFPNSTFTTCPASDGSDFDLSFNVAQTTQETPFEASGTDAFGVNLGSVYSLMDPVGQTLGPFDMGALT